VFKFDRLSEKERIDLLEYLSFQTKTGMSYKAALARYLDGGRVRRVVEKVEAVIEAISAGVKPADAFLEAGILSESEFTLISNTNSPSEALFTVVALSKAHNKSADVLKSSIRTGLFMLGGLLMLIPFFREDIEQIYMMFATMSTMASGASPDPQIPFLVKYWWSAFVVVGAVWGIFMAASLFVRHIYRFHGAIYYRVIGYTVYKDLVTVLTSLKQMGKVMSWSQAYTAISQSAPNSYWAELFSEVSENLKQGGKASSVVAHQRGIIPVEVVHCFLDGEDTGEVDIYLQKAIELSQDKFDKAQERIRTAVPIFFDLLMFFLIGLVAVKFTQDMNELGIMQVLTQIR
jgi:type II secretory pathway component PulF